MQVSRKDFKRNWHGERVLQFKISTMVTMVVASPTEHPSLAASFYDSLEHDCEVFTAGRRIEFGNTGDFRDLLSDAT